MTIRKAALQIAAVVLLILMACNAYLAIDHLKRMQASAALGLESSSVQADIARVLQDFTDMETGQRGYLLTDDNAYLQPYNDAKATIGTHLANLRSALANRPQSEQALETQLEFLAASKKAEMERTISLRQQGYRHRAFQLIQSNEGKQYSDEARALVSQLSSMENTRSAALEKQRDAISSQAMSQTIAANLCLLVLTAGLFLLIRFHERALERQAAQAQQALAVRDSQLEKLISRMSAAADQTRALIAVIEENARLLLEKYDGFLPPLGYACATQIKEATTHLEQLRKDLLGHPESGISRQAA